MNWAIIITIILIGIIGLVLEFLVVPGGIVGVVSGLIIAGGIGMAYYQYGALAGNITLIVTVVGILIGIVFLLRSRTWKKLMLNTQIDSKVNEVNEAKIKVGSEGITVSRLAPGGKASFDGEIAEVFSAQEFIDENKEITVLKIEGNRITVKLK
jgi:membrane-bound ClpP family serine protease